MILLGLLAFCRLETDVNGVSIGQLHLRQGKKAFAHMVLFSQEQRQAVTASG
jgi:hypothetical protein